MPVNKFIIFGALAVALLSTAIFITYRRTHHSGYKNFLIDVTSTNTTEPVINPTAVYDAYVHYKNRHSLKFGAQEDQYRLKVFTDNYEIIAKHARKNLSYTLGFTSLAHYTREEFSSIKLGYNGQKKTVTKVQPVIKTTNKVHLNIPNVIDWSTLGAVTAIKDQGQCGSCWSFSTTGSLEGLNAIKNKQLVPLSEQELIDCSTSYGNQGCSGGLMDQAFQYVVAQGISTEADYPYSGTDGNECQASQFKRAFKINGFKDVTVDSDKALVQAIAEQPVSVAIEADTSDFQLYTSGVLTGDACGTQLDHGVLAVGYGVLDSLKFIKVKNSWGPSWGLAGYVLIGRADGAGVCGINSAASYPTL